ncbi:Gfo/Idh/MocA family oxidoreductase [Dactylosporangium sp. NPDC049140]|uniref:Gfo/Idh/MocA family protein n=1 Tax=Dactylosporangium sp. NPDC049140 TaxID=3155647 RepID=UPI00340EB31F
MIRIGLVGAGPWANMFTAPMLAAAPDVSLDVVWARRAEAAVAVADRHGATAAGSFEDLLSACDAVAFTVPPDVQAELAVAAARAGRHLLLEKPVGFTVAAAEAVAAAADAAGVATQLMLTYRYTDQVRTFLAQAAGARPGYVRVAYFGGGALDGSPFATPWRREAQAVLPDLGPHTLDLLEATAGPVAELRAAEAGEVVTVTTVHEGGARGHVAISGTTPGPGGVLEAEAVTTAGRVHLADPTPYEPGDVQRTIVGEFVRTVRGEQRQPLDVHHGVRLQRLIAATATAIRTGGAVRP